MAGGMIFHTRSRDTLLCRAGGGVKLIMLILISILISTGSELFVLALSALLLLTAVIDSLPPRIIFKDGIFFLILAIFIAVTELLATSSALLAAVATLRFLSIVIASLILTDTTTADDVARGTGALLYPFLRSYAWRLASLVELTISMLPVITDTLLEINEGRKARGGSFLRHPIRSLTELSVSMLARLFSYVDEYADALSARGYDSSARRYTPPLNKADAFLILVMVLIIGGYLWTR